MISSQLAFLFLTVSLARDVTQLLICQQVKKGQFIYFAEAFWQTSRNKENYKQNCTARR
jgi:hypothetical protein